MNRLGHESHKAANVATAAVPRRGVRHLAREWPRKAPGSIDTSNLAVTVEISVISRIETVTETPDDRSLLARAAEFASTVTTICLQMVIPVLLGYGLDVWLGTRAVFAILGGLLGLAAGLWSLMRLTAPLSRRPLNRDRIRPDNPQDAEHPEHRAD